MSQHWLTWMKKWTLLEQRTLTLLAAFHRIITRFHWDGFVLFVVLCCVFSNSVVFSLSSCICFRVYALPLKLLEADFITLRVNVAAKNIHRILSIGKIFRSYKIHSKCMQLSRYSMNVMHDDTHVKLTWFSQLLITAMLIVAMRALNSCTQM